VSLLVAEGFTAMLAALETCAHALLLTCADLQLVWQAHRHLFSQCSKLSSLAVHLGLQGRCWLGSQGVTLGQEHGTLV